ncbi:MAG TPA: ATP-binding protein [Polyangiaceae bacterium]
MDLRTRTSLFCGALALAIAVSILLRGRLRRAQILFAAFAADVGLWYLAQWLYLFVRADVWARFTAVLAVLLPQFGLHLFEAIVPSQKRPALLRVAGALLILMLILVLSPQQGEGWARGAVFLYVFGLLTAGLWSLLRRGNQSASRAVQRRVRFLVLIGALAAVFTLADFLWFIGAPLPPVGAVLSIVFLFVLSESMIRRRLVDLYDTLGQLLVSTALAFCLAGIFYVCVVLIGAFDTMYLAAILALIVILVLFEPLREKVDSYIHKAFFRERVDLERAVGKARTELVHTLQIEAMQQVVLSALEASHRVTGAALYLRDPVGDVFELGAAFGPTAPPRLDRASARPLVDRLEKWTSVVLEEVAAEASELREAGRASEAEADERVLAAAEVLGPFKKGVCLAVRSESRDVVGVMVIVDDRMQDAFSPDEVALLEALALQIGVVVENSRQYRRMQERDRLAALGQMAAGMAHEIKNPLGAIKGAAQLLSEPDTQSRLQASDREFLSIIVEEVDRLDRVVGAVLHYARPNPGEIGPVDVNAVIKRTLLLLASDHAAQGNFETDLEEGLPLARADAELLRQILINLVRNAVESAPSDSTVDISSRRRARADGGAWVEIAVRDRGPGIAPHVVKDLFVPFFTTKPKGTGLGLAISRRIVEDMAGLIEVSSQEGQGATFTVLLPVAEDPLLAPRFEAPRADPAASAGSGASAPSASEAEPAVPAGEPLTRPL